MGQALHAVVEIVEVHGLRANQIADHEGNDRRMTARALPDVDDERGGGSQVVHRGGGGLPGEERMDGPPQFQQPDIAGHAFDADEPEVLERLRSPILLQGFLGVPLWGERVRRFASVWMVTNPEVVVGDRLLQRSSERLGEPFGLVEAPGGRRRRGSLETALNDRDVLGEEVVAVQSVQDPLADRPGIVGFQTSPCLTFQRSSAVPQDPTSSPRQSRNESSSP